jgi:hypothetical protein
MSTYQRELDETALKQGVDWAERMFSRLLMWGHQLPTRWPGTREYARALVLGFARHSDPVVRERLVLILHGTAESKWREFTARSQSCHDAQH